MVKQKPTIDNFVSNELEVINTYSNRINLPRLMNQYMSLMTYRLSWKINENISKEQLNEMSKEVLKYMKVSYKIENNLD